MQRNQTWFNCNGSGIRRWYLHAVHKIWRLLLSLLNLEYTCTVTEVHLCLWIHSDDFELGSIRKCTNGIEQRVKLYKVLNSAINSASSRKPIHYTIMNWTNPWKYFAATMDRSIRVRKWIIRFLFTCSASSFYVLVCAHSLGDYLQHFDHHRHQSFYIINEN